MRTPYTVPELRRLRELRHNYRYSHSAAAKIMAAEGWPPRSSRSVLQASWAWGGNTPVRWMSASTRAVLASLPSIPEDICSTLGKSKSQAHRQLLWLVAEGLAHRIPAPDYAKATGPKPWLYYPTDAGLAVLGDNHG